MRRRDGQFIERSILGALSFFKDALFAEEYALKRGFFQGLDPRIKLVSVILLLFLVLIAKSILPVVMVYFLCLALVKASAVPLKLFLKRTWTFVPLFTLIIAVPAIFSVITPGQPVWIGRFLEWKLIVTEPGLNSAVIFFVRVLTSVSLGALLILTTQHYVLLKVLRIFRVPQVFVMVLGMCYRYIYLIVETAQNMYLAIQSRVGFVTSARKGQKVVAGSISGLWWRSYQMQNDVYLAMLSRGYEGESKVLDRFSVKIRDWDWLLVVVTIFMAGICGTYFLN